MATQRGPDNSVRVAIQGTFNGVNWANVFRCQLNTSSSIVQADLDSWLSAFQAAYKTRFAPIQTSSAQYAIAKAVLYTPGLSILNSVVTMTGSGTQTGTAVENAGTCKVISWLSTVYWRGGKPRTYSPAVAQADVANNNSLLSTPITNAQTAAANFRADVNALTAGTITGTTFGFVSFSAGSEPRPTPLFFAITGARVHPRLGSQRRRLGKWQN